MALFNSKLLIFDLDGTLIDTRQDLANSINHALKECNVRTLQEEKIFSFTGNGIDYLIDRCVPKADSDKLPEIREAFVKHYEKNLVVESTVLEGVTEVLNYFSDKTLCILSNKPEKYCRMILEAFKLDGYFKEIVGGDTFGVMKPEKTAVKKLYKKYKVLQEETILVGDGPQDINAAKNAGIKMAAVTYGYHSENRLKKENPDLLLDTLTALMNYID